MSLHWKTEHVCLLVHVVALEKIYSPQGAIRSCPHTFHEINSGKPKNVAPTATLKQQRSHSLAHPIKFVVIKEICSSTLSAHSACVRSLGRHWNLPCFQISCSVVCSSFPCVLCSWKSCQWFEWGVLACFSSCLRVTRVMRVIDKRQEWEKYSE